MNEVFLAIRFNFDGTTKILVWYYDRVDIKDEFAISTRA